MADGPKVVCIFSGKRKSGKDFVVEKLKSLIGVDRCEVLRLSGPLKHEYALIHGLDFDKLLDSSSYKEKFRKDMIQWGEDKRNQDPSYFCSLAAKMAYHEDSLDNSSSTGNPLRLVTKQVWFVSDARRVTDLLYFRSNYAHVLHVRVEASEEVRKSRGWTFTAGIDDAESECGLDNEIFEFVIKNEGDDNQLMIALMSLQKNIKCTINS
jgi:phosphomevalonate kinase